MGSSNNHRFLLDVPTASPVSRHQKHPTGLKVWHTLFLLWPKQSKLRTDKKSVKVHSFMKRIRLPEEWEEFLSPTEIFSWGNREAWSHLTDSSPIASAFCFRTKFSSTVLTHCIAFVLMHCLDWRQFLLKWDWGSNTRVQPLSCIAYFLAGGALLSPSLARCISVVHQLGYSAAYQKSEFMKQLEKKWIVWWFTWGVGFSKTFHECFVFSR